jgi:hypothetical protein
MGRACSAGLRLSEPEAAIGSARREQGRANRQSGGEFDWVVGADGKSRRVKSGVRLLAHGVSGRVGVRRTAERAGAKVEEKNWYSRIAALKGFGNAVDLRPASAFIGACMQILIPALILTGLLALVAAAGLQAGVG